MKSGGPAVSAIVCTCNRETYLDGALRSLVDQTLPRAKYEIIVVDNGSAASRAKTVCEKYGDVTYIYEPRIGVSYARNTGWRAAKGKIVAYLDDDEIASRDWLEMILKSFSQGGSCIGGKVLPSWEAPRPTWLTDNLLWALGVLDWGIPRQPLPSKKYLNAGNIAFKREVIESVGGFREDLGLAVHSRKRSRRLLAGEETEIQIRISSYGGKLIYDPAIVVTTAIPAQHLRKRWFIERAFWQGVTDALIFDGKFLGRCNRIVNGLRQFASIHPRELLGSMLWPDDGRRLTERCVVAGRIGYVCGLWWIQPFQSTRYQDTLVP